VCDADAHETLTAIVDELDRALRAAGVDLTGHSEARLN